MIKNEIVLVFDAGNTALKVGVFKNSKLIETHRIKTNEPSSISKIINQYNFPPTILSSVLSKDETEKIADLLENCILVDHYTPLPIHFNYSTFSTLGIDRICNACAIAHLLPGKNSVSIDIGTCLKFDLVDEKSIYQGGSISPGIQLRYKSLHDYTANLPLLTETENSPLVGKSTSESIHSGVMNGILAEINQMMLRYTEEFGQLTFFMTGGDVHFFEIPLKNNIFVDENLTLKGLYQIYLFNAH